jgi:hypothetical protein
LLPAMGLVLSGRPYSTRIGGMKDPQPEDHCAIA